MSFCTRSTGIPKRAAIAATLVSPPVACLKNSARSSSVACTPLARRSRRMRYLSASWREAPRRIWPAYSETASAPNCAPMRASWAWTISSTSDLRTAGSPSTRTSTSGSAGLAASAAGASGLASAAAGASSASAGAPSARRAAKEKGRMRFIL